MEGSEQGMTYTYVHRLLMGRRSSELLVVDNRGLVALWKRARHSHAVSIAVDYLGLGDLVNQQATDAHPNDFVILGPLGVAAYRATWMEELDGQGRRVPRATQPNEHGASLPTNTTTVVEP